MTNDDTKTDEFFEKFQRAFDLLPSFSENHVFPEKLTKKTCLKVQNLQINFRTENDFSENSSVVVSSDMEFVQNFTPPDFQAKNFTQSISPNFNSFSKKQAQKLVQIDALEILCNTL